MHVLFYQTVCWYNIASSYCGFIVCSDYVQQSKNPITIHVSQDQGLNQPGGYGDLAPIKTLLSHSYTLCL